MKKSSDGAMPWFRGKSIPAFEMRIPTQRSENQFNRTREKVRWQLTASMASRFLIMLSSSAGFGEVAVLAGTVCPKARRGHLADRSFFIFQTPKCTEG